MADHIERHVLDSAASMTVTWPGPPTSTTLQVPPWVPLGQRKDVVYQTGRRLFGIDWWADRQRFTAVVIGWIHKPGSLDTNDEGELEFSVISPVTAERAELWRRIGYQIVKWLPHRETTV